jgi:hypothetical protein
LTLVDSQSGQPIPFQFTEKQISNGKLLRGRIHFFADLEPGGQRRFELKQGGSGPVGMPIACTSTGDIVEIQGEPIKVRIPASRDAVAVDPVPGPIVSVCRDGKWMGSGKILSGSKKVARIESKIEEDGPLFVQARIHYTFEGGASYSAVVRVVKGYDFVELREQMEGFEPDDRAAFELNWTDFHPNKRFWAKGYDAEPQDGWPEIGRPVMTAQEEEDPKWDPGTIENPSDAMFFRLAAYSGNAVREAVPTVSFWNDQPQGKELGAFVIDTLGWNDRQYNLWQPTPRLDVRFRWRNDILTWTWPLVSGMRATGIDLHDAAESQRRVEDYQKGAYTISPKFPYSRFMQETPRLRWNELLRSWYGGLSLDHVKDWILTYPETAKQPPQLFKQGKAKNADDLEKMVLQSCLPIYPFGLNVKVLNIEHRPVYDWMMDGFVRFKETMKPEQRKRLTALFLLSAYVNAGEDLSPIRICEGGTPNMNADGWTMPVNFAFLFPDHPMAATWRDEFEKRSQINALYFTRPDVKDWDAKGGRWTESLGIYTWAYLRPVDIAHFLAFEGDGKNRMANPGNVLKARWLVDELTAPVYNPNPRQRNGNAKLDPRVPPGGQWKPGMPLLPELGFTRQYPGHGAHSNGSTVPPSAELWRLGYFLRNYDPLTAEHAMWAYNQAKDAGGAEYEKSEWKTIMEAALPPNTGTRPRLESSKYTGHGFILRAGVGTSEELSIHLDQVDAGPNYRWGDQGEGANGVLSFYARGQLFTAHERENTGDHALEETLAATNAGFLRDGKFRCIGENVLDQPLYDLGGAQFAEIKSRPGPSPYSWPDYSSRSVLLVGTDYFLTFDESATEQRMRYSWFSAPDFAFPKLIFLKPSTARDDHWTEVRTALSNGILRDAKGSTLTLVTHKGDAVTVEGMTSKELPFIHSVPMRQYSPARNAKLIDGVYTIDAPGSRDFVFRNKLPVAYQADGIQFEGTAGVVRAHKDRSFELALIKGSRIAAGGVVLEKTLPSEAGISAAFSSPGQIQGKFVSMTPAALRIACATEKARLYIDGGEAKTRTENGAFVATFPAGHHDWEVTAGLPKPLAPAIERTENQSGQTLVFWQPVAGATGYRLETSSDGGVVWTPAAQVSEPRALLKGLSDGRKIHVRVIAKNASRESDPSPDYPIYVTAKPSESPDGLAVELGKGRAALSWGQMLGVHEYRLYRRSVGAKEYKLIWNGLGTQYIDMAEGIEPPDFYPDARDAFHPVSNTPVYEYAVSAVNGNGESVLSQPVSTNPALWLAWWPAGQQHQFKRPTAYWMPPYVPASRTPLLHYPD